MVSEEQKKREEDGMNVKHENVAEMPAATGAGIIPRIQGLIESILVLIVYIP